MPELGQMRQKDWLSWIWNQPRIQSVSLISEGQRKKGDFKNCFLLLHWIRLPSPPIIKSISQCVLLCKNRKYIYMKTQTKARYGSHIYNPSTWKVEVGRLVGQGQPMLHELVLQNHLTPVEHLLSLRFTTPSHPAELGPWHDLPCFLGHSLP